jgi:hypothetical protein
VERWAGDDIGGLDACQQWPKRRERELDQVHRRGRRRWTRCPPFWSHQSSLNKALGAIVKAGGWKDDRENPTGVGAVEGDQST